jgi:hypothetical protein
MYDARISNEKAYFRALQHGLAAMVARPVRAPFAGIFRKKEDADRFNWLIFRRLPRK